MGLAWVIMLSLSQCALVIIALALVPIDIREESCLQGPLTVRYTGERGLRE